MEHFIAPGLAWLINTCHHASQWGLTPEVTRKMGYHRELEAAVETMKALRQRGVRILPGGDYGFAWTPHGTNAKDLEYFVKYVGMSTMEALLSATAWGGPMMRMGKELGHVREGYLADMLLIDGDPLADITVLQDKARILAVMKDGEFHRAPPVRPPARPAGPPDGEGDDDGRHPLHQRPHPRRQRLDAVRRQRARAGQPDPPGRPPTAPIAPGGATVIDGAGATLMPGMCEAHTHFSWNDAATLGRDPDDAARGARAVVREGREEIPRGRLHVVRRRRLREAAPRRRHPQRDQLGPDPGAALHGRSWPDVSSVAT